MSERVTPADPSRQLCVSPRPVRGFLRDQYGKLPQQETRWLLTDQQAAAVRLRFRS